MRRLTIKDAISESNKHNGECLDKEYINTRTKMNWKCEHDHTFLMTLTYVRRGFWCPNCLDNWYGINDAKQIAKDRGGECLSTAYVCYSGLLRWRCKKQHEWNTTMKNIMMGHWCPYCAGCAKHTLNDCINLAKSNNGFCLSKDYVNGHANLIWKCSLGHIWQACYKSIRIGTWCPECSLLVTKQNKLRLIIEQIFSGHTIRSNYRNFDWLKTIGNRKQEIDIWVPDYKLAIEYDGEQHFMPTCFGNMSKESAIEEFKEIKRRDGLKDEKIKAHPEDVTFFVRFKYDELLTDEYVRDKLIMVGIKLPR